MIRWMDAVRSPADSMSEARASWMASSALTKSCSDIWMLSKSPSSISIYNSARDERDLPISRSIFADPLRLICTPMMYSGLSTSRNTSSRRGSRRREAVFSARIRRALPPEAYPSGRDAGGWACRLPSREARDSSAESEARSASNGTKRRTGSRPQRCLRKRR
ncbi:hypothetical protein OMP38_11050 [Cohnella ginsengisoli]|uniref:Uncharacterized protein n=1 Tax=Cohnella ginsengisoli TaxID=425004 RepID=A0A9X4QMV3_9BACL|nr:hypothetical protein [Cohnella ginsengisoli]MDG0791345.1 hypothetical protein [Cohnella ginsengisoli]